MKPSCVIICVFLLLACNPCAEAGKLRDQESDATRDSPEPLESEQASSHSRKARRHLSYRNKRADDDDDGLADILGEMSAQLIICGGVNSWLLVHSGDGLDVEPRQPGQAIVPFVRVDAGYQNIESDVSGCDLLGQVGYGFFGFQIRTTRYREDFPDDELNVTECHGLYRMSFGNHVEIDIGAGSLWFNGTSQTSGFSFTTPLLIHPSDNFGIEYRPVWSRLEENAIQDNDIAILLGGKYLSIRAGYRWLSTEHQCLRGPHVGISMRW